MCLKKRLLFDLIKFVKFLLSLLISIFYSLFELLQIIKSFCLFLPSAVS